MKDTAAIVRALGYCKARRVPFDTAWASVVGAVPPPPKRCDEAESVERATYNFLWAAYCDSPESRTGLTAPSDEDAAGDRVRGRNRPAREAA